MVTRTLTQVQKIEMQTQLRTKPFYHVYTGHLPTTKDYCDDVIYSNTDNDF